MAEKCKKCDGKGYLSLHGCHAGDCPACDGTGIDLATCEGVPPGSGAERLARCSLCGSVWPALLNRKLGCINGAVFCDWDLEAGIRFPYSCGPNGVRVPLDPDAGRWWRRKP
jgi:hypothetical protein